MIEEHAAAAAAAAFRTVVYVSRMGCGRKRDDFCVELVRSRGDVARKA